MSPLAKAQPTLKPSFLARFSALRALLVFALSFVVGMGLVAWRAKGRIETRKFHESIPLPARPAQVALGAARAALWLGFLNRALQSPQGHLADFLSKNVELQNWGGSPYVVAGTSA
jgi:hypothetical protein